MPNVAWVNPANMNVILLLSAAVAALACRWALADALRPLFARQQWINVLASWVPIALAALWAMYSGLAMLALGIVFAASVAALTWVIGFSVMRAPAVVIPAEARRLWPFLTPVALLLWLIGFSGRFEVSHALALLLEGLVLFFLMLRLWRQTDAPEGTLVDPSAVVAQSTVADAPQPAPRRRGLLRALQALLGIAVGLLGAWALCQAMVGVRLRLPIYSLALLAVLLAGPLLIVPLLHSALGQASRGRTSAAISQCVAVVFLNFCLLLPVLIFWQAWSPVPATAAVQTDTAHISEAATQPTATEVAAAHLLDFPHAAWRIDCTLLAVVGMFLTVAASGQWTLARAEGMALAGGYFAYLLMNLLMASGRF